MRNYTAIALSSNFSSCVDLTLTRAERSYLRDLALRAAQHAQREDMREKAGAWQRHNDLERGARPMVFCDPENGWNEILPDGEFFCKSPLAAEYEARLKKELFYAERMGDDKVCDGTFAVPYIAEESDCGMRHAGHRTQADGSESWDAPLTDYALLDRLKFPKITVFHERSQELLEFTQDLFGDILRVSLKGFWWWSLGLTQKLIYLRGLEQIFFDMYDYPEQLHKVMRFLMEAELSRIDFLEDNGLLSSNAGNTYVGSGGFGYTKQLPQADPSAKVRCADMWGFGESQETSSVSGEMFAEFIFPYQREILSRFGLNCYGCCEPLENRFEYVKTIPNLRRISVSPWANFEKMAEYLQDEYILSYKFNPAYIATGSPDWDFIEKELKKNISVAKKNHCRLEIIMKDNHTLGGNPRNASDWCALAKKCLECAW